MAIDVLITPASGSIYISGSEAQTPTPPNLTNGTNYLWASGTTLQWGSQEVYTNAPGTSEITGGGSANQVAYYSAATTIAGSANLTFDGTNLKLGDSKKLLLGAGSDFQLYHQGDASSYIYNASNGLFIWNNVSSGGVLELRSDDLTNGIKFDIGGTDKMFINNLGFGIGLAPSYPLHINHVSGAYAIETTNTNSRGIRFGDTSGDGTGYGKIEGKGGSLFLGSSQIYTSLLGTGDANTTLGSSGRRWSYFFARYGQFGYSTSQDENSSSGGYVLGVSGNADRHPFMVKAYGQTTPNFIVTSGARVGVGTGSPTETLDVRGGTLLSGTTSVIGNITGSSNLNLGTGVELQGGGTSTFSNAVNIGATTANQNTYLKIMGSGAGYTAAGIKLLTYNGANRPGGVYSYNHPDTEAWYSGPVYGASYKWGVNYKSSIADTGSGLEVVADDANNFLIIDTAGNVGINTTGPSKKLHVNGTTQVDGEFFATAGGDITAGSWRWRDDALLAFGTGRDIAFVWNDTNQLLYLVSGNSGSNNKLWSVDVSGNTTISGNVGIGTDSPSEKLQLKGDSTYFSILAADGSEGVRLGTASSGKGLFYLRDASGNNKIYLEGGGTSYINGGKVGIGTTSSINDAELTVLDTTRQLVLAYDGSNYFNFAADGNYLNITANSTNKSIVSLRDNGNFYFNGDNIIFETASEKYFQLKGTNVLGFGSGRDFSMSASGNVFYMTSGATNPNTTPILGISQAGEVGIGTSSPDEYLEVRSSADDDPAIRLTNNRSGASGSLVLQHRGSSVKIKSENDQPMGFVMDSTEVITIHSDNNVGIGTVAPDVKLDVRGDTNVSGTLGVTSNVDVGNRVRYKAGTTKFLDFTGDGATSITMSGFQAFRPGTSGNAAGNGQDLGTTSFPWDKIYSQGLTLSNQTGGDSSPGAKTIWVSGSDVYWGTSKLNAQSGGGGSVAGSDTQVQFNDGGAFGADAGLTYAKATDTLTAGAYNLENLDDQLTWAGRNDLLIQGTTSYDMELISPQDMAFSIDSDNNETAHKFLFRTNSKTPSTSGTTLMGILETGRVGVNTASPGYSFDVRGTASFRDEGSSSQRLLMYGQNDHFTLHVTGSSHKLAIQTGGPGVEFQDAGGNEHLLIKETGTNGALLSGTSDVQINATGDIYLGADGADIFFTDESEGGTFGKFTNNGVYWDINGNVGSSYLRFIPWANNTSTAYTYWGDTTHNQQIIISSSGSSANNTTTLANSFFKQTDGAGNTDTYIQAGGGSYFINNLGIGTNSPGQSLDVDGNVRVRDSHTLAAGDSDDFYLYHDGNSTLRNNTGIFNITQNATSNLVMITNGNSNQLVLEQANGRVGIGTSSPDGGKLHINSAATDQALKLESTDGNVDATFKDTGGSGIIRFASNIFKFYTAADYSVNPLNINNADVEVTNALSVTGPTLAVQKTIKNDIVGAHTFSDSYSHYLATADNMGDATCTLTCPASPAVGDEYFIVARCVYASAAGGSSLVRIQPNTGQTINAEVNNGSYIALNSLSSGTGAGGGPLMNYKTAHLICVDANTWALTLSDVGPTS